MIVWVQQGLRANILPGTNCPVLHSLHLNLLRSASVLAQQKWMCAVSCPLNDDPVEIRILYIWVQQGLRANMLTVLYCTASTCFGVPAYQYNQNGS